MNIYRGVLTGYNEAFIIDGKKKDELIAEDPKSAEIIKPILRGRDIKRYKAEFADLWLLNTHNGYKSKNGTKVPPIDVAKDYPAIKKHLDKYWDKLQKRQDKGITPYNLRNCAYLEEFEKEKIVYSETTQNNNFYKDIGDYFIDKTGFILISNNNNFLLSIFNSKLFKYSYRKLFSSIELGKSAFQLNKHAFELYPIPKISELEQKPFIELVDQILAAKEANPDADTSRLEREIDMLVYELYGLTEEEIRIVEGG